MKKIISVILAVLMITALMPVAAFAEDTVIEIKDAAGLAGISSGLDKSYKLMNDIKLEGAWTPIGGSSAFSGTFEGNGKAITGLNVNISATSGNVYAGLFGNISGTVKNLKVSGSVTVNHTGNSSATVYAGGIAGYCGLFGTIEYCTSNVSVSATLAPTAASGGSWLGDYSGTVYAGGIAGQSLSIWNIEQCASKQPVSAAATPTAASGKKANAYVYAGGIAGKAAYIENCYATGNVTGNASTSSGSSYSYTGGVAGSASSAKTSYSSGSKIVSSAATTNYVGGFAGQLTSASSCYFLKNSAAAGIGYSDGDPAASATAYSSFEMRGKNLSGFNFDSIWVTNATSPPVLFDANSVISGSVTIDGTVQYSKTLTANITAVTPEDSHDYLKYQWYRCTEVNGSYTAIENATEKTYTLTADDIDCYIKVVVKGSYIKIINVYSYGGSIKSSATSKVAKLTPAKPAAPTASSISDTSITLNTVQGCEYMMATYKGFFSGWQNGAWQDSPTFGGLTEGTAYRFYQRVKATSTANPSETSDYTELTATQTASDITITGSVSISGTAKQGETLTAVTSSVSPNNIAFKYRWYRGNTAISGATSSNYTLTASDVGSTIKVEVTANQTGYTGTLTSNATGTVASSVITISGTVSISGNAKYGEALTAVTSSVSPNNIAFKYQWYRGNTAISGATAKSYTLTASDIGNSVKVEVTANQSGYTGSLLSDALTVTKADGKASAAPTASSVTSSGITLNTADNCEYMMATYSEGGFLGIGAGWVNGTWQSAPSFTGLKADTAYRFYQRAAETATANAGAASNYTEIRTAAETTDIEITGTVLISGTVTVGKTLTADISGVTPSNISFTYQWLRNGSDISGAYGKTYTLSDADKGCKISVRVTANQTGYTGAVTSAQTADVSAAYIMGDADLNGKVEVEDARLALRAAVSLEVLSGNALRAADIDNNGSVSVEEARLILRVAIKLDTF